MNKDILYRFFEGTASYEEEKEVREWMEKSTENAKEFFHERKLFDTMILLGNAKTEKLKKSIIRRPIPAYFKEIAKIAALVAITLSLSWLYQQAKLDNIAKSENIITVPAGQRVNITLPDGTNVWLNSRTVIQYPSLFRGGKREIKLNGEAYFEVHHDTSNPFIVHTDKCDIEVLGTTFNVEAYGDSEEFNTSLLKGSVKIIDKSNPTNQVILKPNTRVNMQDGKLNVEKISEYDSFRWKDGLISFKQMEFKELIAEFEKCYGIKIVIQNAQIEHNVLSGKFRYTDGIDYALRILQKDVSFTFERNKEGNVIYLK